jgi:hypothetical protein
MRDKRFIAFVSINKLTAQDLKGAELKSMEKYGGIKGDNGIVAPGLKLSAEQMKWWQDAKFGLFIHWGLYSIESIYGTRPGPFEPKDDMYGSSLKFTQDEKGITILPDKLQPDSNVSTLILETK